MIRQTKCINMFAAPKSGHIKKLKSRTLKVGDRFAAAIAVMLTNHYSEAQIAKSYSNGSESKNRPASTGITFFIA